MGGLARPEKITRAVRELRQRHTRYGVQPAHYETVRTALEFFAATMQDAAKSTRADATA